MSDLNDQQIDAQLGSMVRGHLNDQLDRHVGASSRRFAEMIATERRQRAMPLVENPPKAKRAAGPKFGSFWSMGLVGTALAATMTIVAMRHNSPASRTSPLNRGGSANVVPNPDGLKVEPVAYPGEANHKWEAKDQGLVRMPDGSIARKFLRTTTDRKTWTNPKTKKTYEYIEPRSETVYVGLKQY